MLGGREPVVACVERDEFVRAMLLPDPTSAQDMAPKRVCRRRAIESSVELSSGDLDSIHLCGTQTSLADLGLGKPTLYTATAADQDEQGYVHVFAAFLAVDEQEARGRLRSHTSAPAAAAATLTRGFDPSEPIAASLISDALSDCLSDIARNPTSALAEGLDLYVTHRFSG